MSTYGARGGWGDADREKLELEMGSYGHVWELSITPTDKLKGELTVVLASCTHSLVVFKAQ